MADPGKNLLLLMKLLRYGRSYMPSARTLSSLSVAFCIYMLKVYRLRLLGDYHHSTRIAFVEFVMVRKVLSIHLTCIQP